MVTERHDRRHDESEYYYYPANIKQFVADQIDMNHHMYDSWQSELPYVPYHHAANMYSGTYGNKLSPEQKFLNQFVDDQGQLNIEKTLKTVSQLANTIQQVSPVIKQLNELVKNVRSIQSKNI